MKRFLILGMIGVLVTGVAIVGIEEFEHKKVKKLESKVFEAKTYINRDDLGNAEIMVNIIKEENDKLKNKNIEAEVINIENSIEMSKGFNTYSSKPKKNLENLSEEEKNVELLNLYLENNEVDPDVRSIGSAGKEYYIQFKKAKNLPYDKEREFNNQKGYILKPIKLTKRFFEDTCLIFDAERPYYINNNIYYKFTEIPVSSYFGDGNESTWYFADLNFNIISKENLKFYMDNREVLDSNKLILEDYDLTNYIEDEFLY
ncbi:hypothetical protein [Clostridium sp. LIBA-8841]|uniref:hypothetical protein n=1 Tax=Clostridium sp. LIBA-8841 TaxID=2987530 RepID=UPI002AC4EA74|nr:hypothetical protein [Clostridium sp. LIBA-8841]MDZ5255298.1 hypothetical protein [Clostridium sp. LIBA-8841]